jgi:predicted PurR-regulated permease PerM
LSPATVSRMRAIRVPPADRAILGGLAIIGVILLGSLIYPFTSPLLFAAVLAGALYPAYESLKKRVRGSATIAAGLMTLSVALVVAAPTLWVAVTAGREVLTGASVVERAFRTGGGVRAIIDDLPPDMREQARNVVRHVPGGSDQIDGLAEDQAGKAASVFKSAALATTTIVVKVALMLVALFFFLTDGKPLVKWIATIAPLPERQILEILHDFRDVSVGVLMSSIATAGVQTTAALIGYVVAGVPQPLLFTFATFVFAFIPALGAASVVLLAALFLFFIGRPEAAFYLALWGVCVVGFIDNLVKPWLLKGRVEIHGGLIFFALLGGLATFGPVGVVAGPLILSFFLAVVRLCRREPLRAAA